MRVFLWMSGAMVAVVLTVAAPAFGATGLSRGPELLPLPPRMNGAPGLASSLQEVVTVQRAGGTSAAIGRAEALDVPVSGSLVRVIVVADRGRIAGARAAVTAAGGTIEGSAGDLVQALMPPSGLPVVAAANGVEFVRPPTHAFPLAITGEEVVASNAAGFAAAGFNGAGVKVAIIDLGFTGYAAKLGTELPASVTAVDDCGGGLAGGTAHGTAVAEIVHEVAPSAQLYLICVDTEVDLAAAEVYAKTNGIRIINHSVGWFNGGRGDGAAAHAGSPDATVADARANGILWINAAGNEARTHWSGTFIDDGGGFNVFDGSSNLNQAVIGAGVEACFFLKWDAWPRTTIDYDLLIYGLSGTTWTLVAGSTNNQSAGNLPPTEAACYTNTGATAAFGVAIAKYSAASSPRLDLFSPYTGSMQFQTAVGSIVEPASSPNAMAVGSVCWNGFGLQPYSSQGPTIDGRTKPDISGYDAVSSSVYGPASGCGNGFTGTSAAAPNVAGVAALLLEQTPGLTPAQLQSSLEAKVVDLGPAGKDNSFGAGRLMLPTLPLPPLNSGLPVLSGSAQVGQTLSGSDGTWAGSQPITYTRQWRLCDGVGASCSSIAGQTGSSYVPVAADVGKTLRLRVSASNSAGGPVAADSAASAVVVAAATVPVNSGLPVLSGSAQVGQSLSGSDGTWAGSQPITYMRQWRLCDGVGASCSSIAGQTGSSYVPVAADVGKTLRLRVSASNSAGGPVAADSAASAVVVAASSGGGGGGGGSGAADLYLTGSAEPVSAPVGGTITWRLRVLDDKTYGPATGVYVDLTLPAGVQVVFASADRGQGCVSSGAGTLRCNLDWLSSDQPYAHIVVVTNVTAAGELVLGATVGYSQADSDPSNNTLTLKANTPPPVVPAPLKPPVLVKPVFGKARAQPLQPVSGKQFRLTVAVKRSDTGAPLTAGKLVVLPTLAGKVIKSASSFTVGKAKVALLVPKSAKGKLLRLKLIFTASGQASTRAIWLIYRVR